MKAIVLVSPQPVVRAGSWLNGLSMVRRRSICLVSIRGAMAATHPNPISSQRMKKPMPMCLPRIIRMKNGRRRGHCARRHAMTGLKIWALCLVRNLAGSVPIGLPRMVWPRKTTGHSVVLAGLNMLAMKCAMLPRMRDCLICLPLPRRVFQGPGRRHFWIILWPISCHKKLAGWRCAMR